jgi:benzoylformate decarboxylase
VAAAGDSERSGPDARWPAEDPPESDPINPAAAFEALADVFPDDGIVVLESPSSTLALRNRLRLSKPGSYFFGAGGGLGFGLAASVGVQLAQPDRPVVCVVGEGSVQYAVTAFWTAAAYEVPVTFLVMRNEEYGILKWFAGLESVEGAPGLDLPALETAKIAEGYGLSTRNADTVDALREGLAAAFASSAPELIETRVAAGMALA